MMSDDARLIRTAQSDRAQFSALYTKYRNQVYKYFLFRLGQDENLAEDLCQETFLRAYQQLSRYDERGFSYLTYLLRIAHNLLVSHYRKTQAVPLEHAENLEDMTAQDLERFVDAKLVWSELDQLPPQEREVLWLRYHKDHQIATIARIMRRTPNAVKVLLTRARHHLRAVHQHSRKITGLGWRRLRFSKRQRHKSG